MNTTAKATLTGTAGAAAVAAVLMMSNPSIAPAERVIVSFHDGTSGPVGWPSGFTHTTDPNAGMTLEDYDALIESKQAEWDSWAAQQDAPELLKRSNDKAERRIGAAISNALAADSVKDYVEGLSATDLVDLNRELMVQQLLNQR